MPMKTLKQKMLSVLFVGLAIASCTHDFSEGFRPPEMKLTVSEARTAFEREADALDIVPFGAGAVTRSLDDDIVITPLWNEAVSFPMQRRLCCCPFQSAFRQDFCKKAI